MENKTILKIKKRKTNFITIDKAGIEEPNLSWGASGLLTYLIGKPIDWKINVVHLASVKISDGKEKVTTLLKELRKHNYCHLFEIRKHGKIKEKVFLVSEIPISYEEAFNQCRVSNEDEKYYYIPLEGAPTQIKINDRNRVDLNGEKYFENNLEKILNYKKDVAYVNEKNCHVEPETDLPVMVKPDVAKPNTANKALLIIDNTNNKIINNRTTTTSSNNIIEIENNNSDIKYSFLDEFSNKLNDITKKNIRKNVKDLTKDKFTEILNKTEKYLEKKDGDLNAILYLGLKGEWNFDAIEKKSNIELYSDKNRTLSEDKKIWLGKYAGIMIDKKLKKEIEDIIIDIPIEKLNKKNQELRTVNNYKFKQIMLSLKKELNLSR